MRNPKGYVTIVGDTRPVLVDRGSGTRIADAECDTFTCGHCNRIVHVPVKARPEDIGGLCRQCMGLVCPRCHGRGRCVPLEAAIERMERRDRLHAAVAPQP